MHGAIASEHSTASQIGAAILAAGGNAVDAAIATTLAVGTLNPYHSCIGGGGFAIVLPESGGQVESIDFRVTAPAAATSEFYRTAPTSHGGSAVGVPGQVRGLAALHARHGRVRWAEVVRPSVELARGGMSMGRDLYDYLSLECPAAPSITGSWLASDPEFVATFTQDNVLIPVGAPWFRPSYADTLAAIAADPEAFYAGEIADRIVRAVQDRGGLMTGDDLKSYKPVWRTPLVGSYQGLTVHAPPAPASGAILLSALGTLDALNERRGHGANANGSDMGPNGHGPNGENGSSTSTSTSISEITEDETHHTIEALRLAYGQRTLLGDPAFVAGLDGVQAAWLAGGSGAARAERVGAQTRKGEAYLATQTTAPTDTGTSHITAADAAGGVCSLTTTIGQLFAARIMVPGTGVMLNDSMDDFSVEGKSNHFGYAPSVANYVHGTKRPLSSQCPWIITSASNGTALYAGGSAGGATIISANVQVIRNLVTHGMSARAALAAPRLHDMAIPDKTQLERSSDRGGRVRGWSEEMARGLQGRGHVVEWIDKSMSTPCCIRIIPEGWDAAGDPRKYDAAGAVV